MEHVCAAVVDGFAFWGGTVLQTVQGIDRIIKIKRGEAVLQVEIWQRLYFIVYDQIS